MPNMTQQAPIAATTETSRSDDIMTPDERRDAADEIHDWDSQHSLTASSSGDKRKEAGLIAEVAGLPSTTCQLQVGDGQCGTIAAGLFSSFIQMPSDPAGYEIPRSNPCAKQTDKLHSHSDSSEATDHQRDYDFITVSDPDVDGQEAVSREEDQFGTVPDPTHPQGGKTTNSEPSSRHKATAKAETGSTSRC